MTERIHYKQPGRLKETLEKLGLYEITPDDIVPPEDIPELYKQFPDLAGDRDIGRSDFDGRCQSWRDNPKWWRRHIQQHGNKSE